MSNKPQAIRGEKEISKYRFDNMEIAVLDLQRLAYHQNRQIKQMASILSRLVPLADREAFKDVKKELDHYEKEYLNDKEIDDL